MHEKYDTDFSTKFHFTDGFFVEIALYINVDFFFHTRNRIRTFNDAVVIVE